MLLGTSLAGFLPVLLVLACPLMMVFMMRGMRGGGGHSAKSLDELKAERDQLNEEIGRRAAS
jgi:hypothetical protein